MRTRKHLVTQKQARVLGLDPESNLAAEVKNSAPSNGTFHVQFDLERALSLVPILIHSVPDSAASIGLTNAFSWTASGSHNLSAQRPRERQLWERGIGPVSRSVHGCRSCDRLARTRGRHRLKAAGHQPCRCVVRWSSQTTRIRTKWRTIDARDPSRVFAILNVTDPQEHRRQSRLLSCTLRGAL